MAENPKDITKASFLIAFFIAVILQAENGISMVALSGLVIFESFKEVRIYQKRAALLRNGP